MREVTISLVTVPHSIRLRRWSQADLKRNPLSLSDLVSVVTDKVRIVQCDPTKCDIVVCNEAGCSKGVCREHQGGQGFYHNFHHIWCFNGYTRVQRDVQLLHYSIVFYHNTSLIGFRIRMMGELSWRIRLQKKKSEPFTNLYFSWKSGKLNFV